MAEFPIGKILPNLTVSVGTDNINSSDSPEDSMNKDIDIDSSKVEIVRPSIEHFQNTKVYINKDGGFATGIDLIAQEESGILNKRAERFQLDTDGNKPSISAFYESMGIDVKNRNSAEMKKIRLNAIHVRGVQELNQNEVLGYFNGFSPSEVEWINDVSCNVIFPDEASSARALFHLTKDLPDTFPVIDLIDSPKKTEAPDVSILKLDDNKDEEVMDIDDSPAPQTESVDIPVPPGHWRLGVPHPKAKTMLLRFAKKDDKKLPGAEKRSKYYQIHGNPNYGGLKGLISSSKKHKVQAEANRLAVQKESSSSYKSFSSHQSATSVPKITKPKNIRMRMYADDEELISRKSRSKTHLNESKRSVHSRLGEKYTADDLCHLGTYRDSINDFQDLDGDSSYPREYRDLDKPKVYRDSANGFKDLYRDSSYSREYRDLDKPRVYRNSNKSEVYRTLDKPRAYRALNKSRAYRDLDKPRAYQDLDEPRAYKDLDKPRAYRNFDKDSSSPRTYEFGIKSRNSTWDLRSKLKRNRNDMKPYESKYSRSYDEDYRENTNVKKIGRVDDLKKSSRSFFKRKHRSPLCEDEDDEEEEDEDEKSSVD